MWNLFSASQKVELVGTLEVSDKSIENAAFLNLQTMKSCLLRSVSTKHSNDVETKQVIDSPLDRVTVTETKTTRERFYIAHIHNRIDYRIESS